MQILTTTEAEKLLSDNLKLDTSLVPKGAFIAPVKTLGYCKETGKFLVQDQDGVKEVSDVILRNKNLEESKITGDTRPWYDKIDLTKV